jgi:hypothetical protein
MIKSRWVTADPAAVTIKPPFGSRPSAANPCSISLASRESIALSSIPDDEATDWMTANCPMLAAAPGSRRTATRFKPGASALSRSSHFPLMLYSNAVNPVVLPPGRARVDALHPLLEVPPVSTLVRVITAFSFTCAEDLTMSLPLRIRPGQCKSSRRTL